MNKKTIRFILLFFLLTIACSFLDLSISEIEPSLTPPTLSTHPPKTPTSETFLSIPTPTLESINECAPENWKIDIVSVEQIDLFGENTIVVKIGIENNGSFWGSLSGPHDFKGTNNPKSYVVLTTANGSTYETTHLSYISTALIPPGFFALGQTTYGLIDYYGFAFNIPASETPELIEIGGLEVFCNAPSDMGEYLSLPAKTYNLNADVANIYREPPAINYPDLIGSKLDLPDMESIIEFTNVTRNGNAVNISYSITNSSSYELYLSFDGYIVGDGHVLYCQTIGMCDHDTDPNLPIIEPGQTVQDLTWSFTVPEDENNLLFIYVYGNSNDTNKAYRINFD